MHNENHPVAAAITGLLARRRADHQPGLPAGAVTARSAQADIIESLRIKLVEEGVPEGSIRLGKGAILTGALTGRDRVWDLVVLDDDQLVAAVELKTNVGRAFHNNMGNRMEEALGLAADFGRAYNSADRHPIRPFLGFVFVLEENETSTRSGDRPSVIDRYRDFFRRLVEGEIYDAVSYMTFTDSSPATVTEPDPAMGFERFAQALADRVTAFRKLREHHDPAAASVALDLATYNNLSEVLLALNDTEPGHTAVEETTDEIALKRRRSLLKRLREITADPDTPESAVQDAIGKHYWLFGGQYQGILPRRDGMPLHQHDIPLVCSDRSIHVVELKRPGAKLVTRHNSTQLIVSTAVHEAVSQCMNYIRMLDQTGATMQTVHRNELGFDVDYLRAKATVVIGNPDHVDIAGVTREMVDQTIRSYNAHLSRVQVLTYADLIDSAERTLHFTED